MDSLTAAVALVIDNREDELTWACDRVRELDATYDDGEANVWSREAFVRSTLSDDLRERVTDHDCDTALIPEPARSYICLAVSHMYTHTDWRALAQHYMTKVAEGV